MTRAPLPLLLLLLALLASLLLPVGALAQDAPEPLDTAIALESSAEDDAAIADRLGRIFSQIDGLESVEVGVVDGVVRLGGEAVNEADALRAVRDARRVDKVVAVQDSITRTLDVGDNVSDFGSRARAWWAEFLNALPLLAVGIGVWVGFIVLGRIVGARSGLLTRWTPNPFLAEVVGTLVKFVFVLVGLVVALNIMGASGVVTTILGGAGVLGIAFGFAIRDTLENYIASVLLSLRQPFRTGDEVVINETHRGKVARLTSRATILVTPDGNHLRVPNADVFKGTILNYTTNPQRRMTFEFGVDSADDPVSAIETGIARMREFEFILRDPGPSAEIRDVGDSSIVIEYRAWIDQKTAAFGKSRSLVIQAVKNVLESSGFSLPEPIYRLKIDGMDTAALPRLPDTRTGVAATVTETVEAYDKPCVPNDADVTPDDPTDEALARESHKDNLLTVGAEVE